MTDTIKVPEKTLFEVADLPDEEGTVSAPAANGSGPRRVQGGVTTSNVVMSAHVGGNADVFPQILDLHVPNGSRIADVTYGSGVFWSKVGPSRYELLATDIAVGVDCRALPYEDKFLDALVLDPPYMEGLLRDTTEHKAGNGSYSAFRNYYSNGARTLRHGSGLTASQHRNGTQR